MSTIHEWLVLPRSVIVLLDWWRSRLLNLWSLNLSWLFLCLNLRDISIFYLLLSERDKDRVGMLVAWLNFVFPLLMEFMCWNVPENRAHVIRCQMDSFFGFASNPLDWLIIPHCFNDRTFVFVNSWDRLRFVDRSFSIRDVNLLDWNNLHFSSVLRDKNIANVWWILSMVKSSLSWM